VLAVLIAFLPVVLFLAVLVFFDSFKLVPTATLLRGLGMGAVAAVAALAVHVVILRWTGTTPWVLSRYIAPITEETLKACCVLIPLRRRQIGFLVDAAIVGFAIGTGFAVVENIDYLLRLGEGRIWLWIARGFGTAILHATTTAIIALGAKALMDRTPSRGLSAIVPGWLAAVFLHSLFNHALISPLLSAAVLLIVLPMVVLYVFSRSERVTREWVSEGMDLDVELLQLVRSSHFGGTRLGRYLHELRARFPGPVVADMFCLLQLDLELAIRAKGMLMAREAGLEVPRDPDLQAKLAERVYLHKAIGNTGMLALRPLQVTSDRDDWHQYLLRNA